MTNKTVDATAERTTEPTTIEQRVLLLLGEITRHDVNALERDQRLSELAGWDSLAVLDLVSGLEKASGLLVEIEALTPTTTFGDLLTLIATASQAAAS
jgi:acyl carrier protein